MWWTPEVREAALRAQEMYSDDIAVATVERAEALAAECGYDVIDTGGWFQALLDVRLALLDGQEKSA